MGISDQESEAPAVQAGDGPKSPLVSLAPNPSRWLVFMGTFADRIGHIMEKIPLLVN